MSCDFLVLHENRIDLIARIRSERRVTMKARTPEREAVIAQARAWHALRDRQALLTKRVALRASLSISRVVEVLCASAAPTPVEVVAIDQAAIRKARSLNRA